jgi:4-hydroxybenzoate polyprenyltransferase
MTIEHVPQRLPARRRRRFAILPTTYLGKWALALAAASIVLLMSWTLMGRLGGIPGLVLGLAGGVVALVAIFRRGERAVTVFAALFPFLNVVGFVLAELLIGHD